MADSKAKLGAKDENLSTVKHALVNPEHIEHLLEHHKEFRITRDSAKSALSHLKEEYLNTAFGTTKSGTFRIPKRSDGLPGGVKKSLENHASRLKRHNLKHAAIDLGRIHHGDLKTIYEKLANMVAVTVVANLFNATKDDMILTTASDDINSNEVSDLTCIFHLYTFLMSTDIKKDTEGHRNLRHDILTMVGTVMDRYMMLDGIFVTALKTCGGQNFLYGMIAYFTSLKDSPIITNMQYLLTLYATDEAHCGRLIHHYGLGEYSGTSHVKALVDFVRERNTVISLNYSENAKEMDDITSNSYKSTMNRINSTLKSDVRMSDRVKDALSEFKTKYEHLKETELMHPINMLSDLTTSANKGSPVSLKLKKEMLYMRLPHRSNLTWKPSTTTVAFCTALAESLKKLLQYYEDLEKLEGIYAQYVAETGDESEGLESIKAQFNGVLGNPVTRLVKALGKTIYSLASTFFGTVKFELNILLLYQILYASGDAAVFGDWANYILGLTACVYMMMTGNTDTHTGNRSLIANLRHNTEFALKASKSQLIQVSSSLLFEGERTGSMYQVAASPVAAFTGYKYQMMQHAMATKFSMIGRFGFAVAVKNGLDITKTLAQFGDGLATALFSPVSLSDTFRRASAAVVRNDQIYRENFIALFTGLVAHVDSTIGQFIKEALELLKFTVGLEVDTASFDLRVAVDSVIWYYREAFKYSGMIYTMFESAIPYVDEYRITRADDQPVSAVYGIFATILDKIYSALEGFGIYSRPVVDKVWQGDVRWLLEAGWSSFVNYVDPTSQSLTYTDMLRNGIVDTLIGGLRIGGLVAQKAACDCIIVTPAILLGITVNAIGAFIGELPILPGLSVLSGTLRRVGRSIAHLSFRDPGTMKNAVLGHLKYRISNSSIVVIAQLISEMAVSTLEKGIGFESFLSGPSERLLVVLFLQQVFVTSFNHHIVRRLNKNPEPEKSEAPAEGAAVQPNEEEGSEEDVIIASKHLGDDDIESIFQ